MGGEREIKPWNSWEDLLLVCLVQKHGLEESWETISMELKSRVHQNPTRSCPPEFFTPQECMHRFQLLRQEYFSYLKTSNDNGGFEKMIKGMKDKYTKICEDKLKLELEIDDRNIKLQEEKLERLKIGEGEEEEDDGDLRTMADEVVVDAYEDGDDEPSLKMDGNDIQLGRVSEVNELDPIALILCMPKMNKGMMIDVLGKIQRNRSSKFLHHRLYIQKKTDLYRKTIRQHMDLDLIESKIYQDEYTQSFHLFFRDLLLLYNNAIVFFDKSSQEHIVAILLRKKVREEMEKVISNPVEEEDFEEEIESWPVVIGLPAPSSKLAKKSGKPRKPRKPSKRRKPRSVR